LNGDRDIVNLSGISDKTLVGKLLRLPLRFVPPDAVVPILQGKLRGQKWIVGSGHHGCWLGSYEWDKRVAFEQVVGEGGVVFDIGAHVGFYTLLASVLVGASGKVIAFEPAPRNVRYLQAHLRLNHVSNVELIQAAVSDRIGVASFDESPASSTGHLAAGGSLWVKTVTIDQLVSAGEVPAPTCIKIDAEGAEALVLQGGKSVLSGLRPPILLATHGSEVHRECCRLLRSLGYVLKPIAGLSVEETDEIIAFRSTDAHP
jgi:FkbM family methyltransferase